MTWKKRKSKHKNGSESPATNRRRQTPKDIENEKNGIFIVSEPKACPKPTTEENRASKLASMETNKQIHDVRGWIGIIGSELAEMNLGKPGRPFEFCNTMMVWILLLFGFNGMTYAKAAGSAAGILASHGIRAPSISTVHRRLRDVVLDRIKQAPPEDSRIICRYAMPRTTTRRRRVAIDSSGFTLSNFFQYCEDKWKTENENIWLKLHALVDVDSGEVLSYILTYNDVGDPNMLPLLMEEASNAGHGMFIVYADGAYGTFENWKCLSKVHRCRFVTSFRKDSAPKNKGDSERGEAVRLWCRLPYREWVEATGYGIRWKIEGTFSDIKRLVSENFRSRTEAGHMVMSYAKVLTFNMHKGIRADILGTTRNGVFIGTA